MSARQHGRAFSGARHWAAPFVLAMLVVRALVPAGFMLAPTDRGLAIVLCDADASAVLHQHGGHVHADSQHTDPEHAGPGHAGDDHAIHEHTGHHQHTHPDSTCPYAQSSGPAPLPVLPALSGAMEAGVPVAAHRAGQTHAQFGPSRRQSPRGPPALA